MPSAIVPSVSNFPNDNLGGIAEPPVNLTPASWHAVDPGGAPVAWVAGFTDPSALEAPRIPELSLLGAGVPGAYVLIGTFDGEPQTETITTIAGATVKGDLPFDTIVSMTGPDPGDTLALWAGDTFASPVTRAASVGVVGDVACQLEYEAAVSVKTVHNAGDWQRRIKRIEHAGDGRTTATGIALLY